MYKYKYGGKSGKTISLVESPDMVAIRTKDNKKLENVAVSKKSRSLMEGSEEIVAFPEAGVSVRKINVASADNPIEKRDEARTALKAEDDIRFAGRVLQDKETGAVTLYTENFFVKFKDDVPEADCLKILKQFKLSIKDKLVFATNSWFVSAEEGTGLKIFEIAEKLLAIPQVEFCHPEMVQERKFKAIHPLQWHLKKTTIEGKSIDQHINIEKAWAYTKGKGITIAVIDDGVDIDHPEFRGRIVSPRDVSLGTDNPRPADPAEDIHGTACAGVACASGLAGGASGTAPESNLMPIRLAGGLGSMAEAKAFAWATDKGADVISCSWGPTDGKWWQPDDPRHTSQNPLPDSTRLSMEYALTKGRNGKGCVILFAAGNGNENTKFDGYTAFPKVISVAACNDSGTRSVYSDFGDAIWISFPSNDHEWEPLQHPAPISAGIRTTDLIGKGGENAADYRNNFGGTSSACPGMAGVVGLMLAANPALTPAAVKELLKTSVVKIDTKKGKYDAEGHSIYYGFGRVDAALAIENALKTAPKPPADMLEGEVRLSKRGGVPLSQKGMVIAGEKENILGISLKLKEKIKDVSIHYRVNVAKKGMLSGKNGEYAGSEAKSSRILGIAVELKGASASKYTVAYTVQFKGKNDPVNCQNGAFCGSEKTTGKTVEALQVEVLEKPSPA